MKYNSIEEFKKENVIVSELKIKDSRVLYTTHNGFRKWVADSKEVVTQVTDAYYKKVKQLIFNKRNN